MIALDSESFLKTWSFVPSWIGHEMCLNSYQLTLNQIDPNLCIEYVFCKMRWKHMKTNNAHCVVSHLCACCHPICKTPKNICLNMHDVFIFWREALIAWSVFKSWNTGIPTFPKRIFSYFETLFFIFFAFSIICRNGPVCTLNVF